MTTPTLPAHPPDRFRYWLRWVLIGFASLLVLLASTLMVLVCSLDRPWLKRRLQMAIREQVGVEIDWSATRVRPFSGLHVEQLVVHSPPVLRGTAPELARVDQLDVGWSLRSLLGSGPALTSISLHDLALTVVWAENGHTSFSEFGSPGAAPTPPTPLSRVMAELLEGAPPFGRVEVGRISVTMLLPERRPEGLSGSMRVSGVLKGDALALHAEAEPDGGAWRLRAQLGRPSAPLELSVERQRDGTPAGTARARLWADALLAPSVADVKLEVDVLAQTLAPQTPVRHALHVEATGRFDPKAGRTELTIARTTAADGATTVDAQLEVPDDGPVLVRHAGGVLDLVRVLALVPAGLVPVGVERAERAQFRYQVDRLVLADLPQLLDGGALQVEGDLAGLRLTLPQGALSIAQGRATLNARRHDATTTLHAVVPVRSLQLEQADQRLRGEGLEAFVEGRLGQDGTWTGETGIRFGRLDLAGGAQLTVRNGRVGMQARELHVDAAAPLATRGQVTWTARAAALEGASGASRIGVDDLRWTARAQLLGQPPYAVDVELPVARLRLITGGRLLADSPARLDLHVADLFPDTAHPQRTRGTVRGTIELGPLRASLTATRPSTVAGAADALDFQIAANASNLAPLRPLVPPKAGWDASWEQMGLGFTSTGRIDQLWSAAPKLRHRTEVRLDNPRFRERAGVLAAQALTLVLSSTGTRTQHQGEADLRLRKLVIGAAALGDSHHTTSFKLDLLAPSVHVQIATEGDASPTAALTATLGFDRTRRAITYDVDGRLTRLAVLSPLLTAAGLAGFDLSRLELGLTGRGALSGLVAAVDRQGRPRLEPQPLVTLAADGTLELRAAGFRWARGDREIEVPKVAWRAVLTTEGTRRSVRGDLDLEELHVAVGDHQIDVAGVEDELTAVVIGDLRAGEGELRQRLTVRSLYQDLVPGYPIGEVAFALDARRDRDGVIHVSELRLDNQAAGTALTLQGGIDLGGAWRSLSLRGDLQQDLAKVWTVPQEFAGRGTVSMALRIDTGNLRLFHALAALRVTGADVRLPRSGVAIESIDGEIPLSADLVLDRRGIRFLRNTTVNAYSEARFADQHPLLRRHSFVSIARVTTPFVTIAPLAGNLRIDHNIVSISQLEMGLRGGRVTGQCLLDWKEDDTTMQVRVRASHVESSHREPFDGNTAVIISTRERSVEGRAEILRIGRRHLLDLLDLHDPHHADPAVNRIRSALGLGYPDQVRLGFRHGFANVRVTFGGVARLIRVDELRGIPMGPIIDKLLAPLSLQEKEP
jgi:translocation and assembly module TamB